MTIEQTVEVPLDHKLFIEVPLEIPAGPVILTFTPAHSSISGRDPRTVEEVMRIAAERAAGSGRKPISRYFGILSRNTYGDGVVYQRKIRDEWDE